MSKLFYKPQGCWLGDVIPFYEDGKYYLFFLKDPRDSDVKVDHTTWDLLITEDFVHYDHKGVAVPIGTEKEPDNCVYTGSVFKEAQGKYHLFYTAHNNHNPEFAKEGKPFQLIMHAVSGNLIDWQKKPEYCFGSDGKHYEVWDWRDPFVYYNKEERRYNMLLAARKNPSSFRRGGLVLRCWSRDLDTWQIGLPMYEPDMYLTHECPDLFKINDWWYLAYSTFTDKFLTHYRMSRFMNGPWTASDIDTWDARGWYAAKTAGDGNKRFGFGWVPTKEGCDDFGSYEWGGNLVVHELVQQADGTLLARIPDSVYAAYGAGKKPAVARFEGAAWVSDHTIVVDGSERMSYAVFEELPKQCMIECEIDFERPIRSFGIDLNASENLDDGYFFKLEPFYNRLIMDMWPRKNPGGIQHGLGGDIPYQIELERPLEMTRTSHANVRLLIEDDIAVIYVNDTTPMCARLYNLLGNRRWAIFAHDGRIRVRNLIMKLYNG